MKPIPLYTIERVELPTETLGSLYGPCDISLSAFADQKGPLVAKTMELPWKNNQSNVSCIPYTEEGGIPYLVLKMPPGFGRDYGYFRFIDVPGRNKNEVLNMSTILMHRITYVKDLLGCIGIGSRHEDLNKDGVPDMVESGKKLEWMYKNMPDVFFLRIIKKQS